MTYFDSCYLAKLYLMEADSSRVRTSAAELGQLACCAIGWGEILTTLRRHRLENRLTDREFLLLARQVELDVQAGLWKWLPVTTELVGAQARRLMDLSNRIFIRAADALHLTCAAEAGFAEIYSSDRHLIAAAPHFGLRAVIL